MSLEGEIAPSDIFVSLHPAIKQRAYGFCSDDLAIASITAFTAETSVALRSAVLTVKIRVIAA